MSIDHKGTQTIETMRLLLRRFKLEDAEDMFNNWAGDPFVCKYLSWGPHRDPSESRKRIINWINNYENNNFYMWAIELKSGNVLIGSISLEIANELDASCEVGYCIGRQYWNRGIMTEALRAIMHYLFYEVGYVRIQAKHDVLNTASGKVMQKAGMHFVKTQFHAGTRRDGSRYDCDVYEKNITDE